jgi:hypothetical protein
MEETTLEDLVIEGTVKLIKETEWQVDSFGLG